MSSRPSLALQKHIVEAESVNDDNWTMSYIDVFVLMTSIFVVLFMMNKQSMQLANAELPEQIKPPEVTIVPEEALIVDLDPYKKWLESIKQTIKVNGLSSHVTFSENAEFSSLEIRSNVLFDSGEASLSRSGEAVLEKLIPVLQVSKGLVFIEGHTDNERITSSQYSSNWDLAAARATEVLSFFVLEGIPKERLRAVSYGDTHPLVDNDTEQNRQQNRRVSLLLQRPLE